MKEDWKNNRRETMRPTGVTGRQEPLSNYSKRVPMARGPQPVFTVGGIANAKGPDAWHPVPRSGPVGRCVEDGLLRHHGAKLISSPRCEAYFVTSVRSLLRHLAADFAARIGRGVDVDIVLAGREIGGLRVR